jgi:hypothetical protein
MTARRLAVLAMCAACGDDRHRVDDLITAVSGSRLAVQKYRYDDGTELAVASEAYDTQLHVRCRPQRWIDDALRCVPAVDDAVYVDAACTALVGLGRTITRPTHFLAYDNRATGAVPARVFRAGAATTRSMQQYAIVDGACVGPTPVPPEIMSFFELGDELDGSALVEFHDGDLGGGRLALQVRETEDGLRLPIGLRDRALDVACAPRLQGDGGVACEPSAASPAAYFRDAACSEPVVAAGATEVPTIARVVELSGCARYYSVGRELSPPVYRRDGEACSPVVAPVEGRLFSVEAAIELPAIERSREDVRDRRLQRRVLDHDGLRFLDDRLFDTLTGAECTPRTLRDGIRCLPASVAAIGLFDAGCTTPVRVAELPQRMCERIAFATTNRPFELHGVGEPPSSPLFRRDPDGCKPYTGPAGTELRLLGPALDLTTFVSGIYFGERSP